MDLQKAREYFLSKTGAKEEFPFNVDIPVFKVGNKMFGLINHHEPNRLSINLKYPKDKIYELRSVFIDIKPGYHMNKDNWNTIYLDGNLDDGFIKELIDISYDLIYRSLTKKIQMDLLHK